MLRLAQQQSRRFCCRHEIESTLSSIHQSHFFFHQHLMVISCFRGGAKPFKSVSCCLILRKMVVVAQRTFLTDIFRHKAPLFPPTSVHIISAIHRWKLMETTFVSQFIYPVCYLSNEPNFIFKILFTKKKKPWEEETQRNSCSFVVTALGFMFLIKNEQMIIPSDRNYISLPSRVEEKPRRIMTA